MSCSIDCRGIAACGRHATLALEAAGREAHRDVLDTGLEELATALGAARSSSARRELLAAGEVLAARLAPCAAATPGALDADRVVAGGSGAPLLLGAVAVTAARWAGLPLGLLAGPRGEVLLGHATFAQPLALDLADGFAPVDVAGREAGLRWLCAQGTAGRVRLLRRRVGRPAAVRA